MLVQPEGLIELEAYLIRSRQYSVCRLSGVQCSYWSDIRRGIQDLSSRSQFHAAIFLPVLLVYSSY